MANGDGIVYTTKELLQGLDEKLDKLDAKLDRKADSATVDALAMRLTLLENLVAKQEAVNAALREQAKETQDQSASNFTRREKIIATIVGLAALLLQIAVATRGAF